MYPDAPVSELQHLDPLPLKREVLSFGRELQDQPVEADGVVAPDDSPLLETQHPVELPRRGRLAPDRLLLARGHAKAAGVVRQEGAEHAVSFFERAGTYQAQLDDEPILEDAPLPFDPSFGLRRGGFDDRDA